VGREGCWGRDANRKTPIKEAGGIEPISTVSTTAAIAATLQAAVGFLTTELFPATVFPPRRILRCPHVNPLSSVPGLPKGCLAQALASAA